MRHAALILIVLCSLAHAGDDSARVRWWAGPSVVWADTLHVYQLRVYRHPENRRVLVGAFDEFGVRVSYSDQPLEGEDAPSLLSYRWRLPEGEYALVASVWDQRQEVGRAVHRLSVQGR